MFLGENQCIVLHMYCDKETSFKTTTLSFLHHNLQFELQFVNSLQMAS